MIGLIVNLIAKCSVSKCNDDGMIAQPGTLYGSGELKIGWIFEQR